MPSLSPTEAARLEALDAYAILDTKPEQDFDDLTAIAAAVCGVPISMVSFVSGNRQWFKAERGLDLRETSRDLSFCAHTLESKQTLIVSDTLSDPRFQANALVTGAPGIRFYAGAPIIERNGHALGTVCVIDRQPRTLSAQQVEALEALARQAVMLLEHRTTAVEKAELAEEALNALRAAQQSAEQLQLAIDSAHLAAWYYDPMRGVVGGDARMMEFFGLQSEVAPAEAWLATVAEEDRARVASEFGAGLVGAPYDTKYRVRVEGATRWLHARAKVSLGANSEVRMVGICEDVSREEILTADLAKVAQRLAMAQSVSGATTFDWNVAKDEISWSSSCFGRRPEDLRTSRDVFALLPAADRDALSRVVSAAIESGPGYYQEFQVYWPDGSLRWFSTAGKVLRDAQGKATSVVGVNLDVHERRLAQELLLRSEKLAAVGRLASTISHEVNNPLEAVTNLLYLVRCSPDLSPQDRDHLEMADRELARVTSITAQTLRYHRTPLNAARIQASALLQEGLDLYQTRLEASAIGVHVEAAADAVFHGFEGDLRQVLNTLLGNAFDAMRQGGTLRLRARRAQEWHSGLTGVVITIADTGTGMTRAVQDRIFEAFFSTKGIGGTGLGLWIASRIVHKHKGRLRFRSREGEVHGTVFRLWLPEEVAATASDPWAQDGE